MALIGQGHEVILVSGGVYSGITSVNPMVREHILPVNDKLKQVDDYLNHTNVTLNARVATWLVRTQSESLRKGLKVLYPFMDNLLESLPEMTRRPVRRMTDDEVLAFIRKHYNPDSSTATKLLTQLRHQENRSCEQKRFGRLFMQFKLNNKGGLFDV